MNENEFSIDYHSKKLTIYGNLQEIKRYYLDTDKNGIDYTIMTYLISLNNKLSSKRFKSNLRVWVSWDAEFNNKLSYFVIITESCSIEEMKYILNAYFTASKLTSRNDEIIVNLSDIAFGNFTSEYIVFELPWFMNGDRDSKRRLMRFFKTFINLL